MSKGTNRAREQLRKTRQLQDGAGDLPFRPPIMRGRANLSDQFAYRYWAGNEGSLFLLIFRNTMVITGCVAETADEHIAANVPA